jgi:hypothetical protein
MRPTLEVSFTPTARYPGTNFHSYLGPTESLGAKVCPVKNKPQLKEFSCVLGRPWKSNVTIRNPASPLHSPGSPACPERPHEVQDVEALSRPGAALGLGAGKLFVDIQGH